MKQWPRCTKCWRWTHEAATCPNGHGYGKRTGNGIAKGISFDPWEIAPRKSRVAIQWPGHPDANGQGYVVRARIILAEKLGRPLKEGEIAHHVNEQVWDDRPENLEATTVAAHNKHHHKTNLAMKGKTFKPTAADLALAKRLREYKEKNGTSNEDIAQAIGVRHGTIGRWLRGENLRMHMVSKRALESYLDSAENGHGR